MLNCNGVSHNHAFEIWKFISKLYISSIIYLEKRNILKIYFLRRNQSMFQTCLPNKKVERKKHGYIFETF